MSDIHRKILDTTVELIADQGVRNISFREVARRAGVSHQAPYHHFGNLQGILRAVTREGFASLRTSMRDAVAAVGDDPNEQLIALGINYVTFATSHIGHFLVMFEASLVDLQDPGDPIAEADECFTFFARTTERAWLAGYGRSINDPDTLVQLCWSTVHGLSQLIIQQVLQKKMAFTPTMQDALIKRVINALGILLAKDKAEGVTLQH